MKSRKGLTADEIDKYRELHIEFEPQKERKKKKNVGGGGGGGGG